MSHTTIHETSCRNASVIERTCRKLNVKYLGQGEFHLTASHHRGIGIHLTDWHLPVIFDEQGKAAFDSYNGRWGNEDQLHRFCQEYGVEAARFAYEHRAEVASIDESILADGSRRLVVTLHDNDTAELGSDDSGMFAESARS